jgi:hypothetical protein
VSVRQKLNENPAVVTTLAAVALAVALFIVWYDWAGPSEPTPESYYFDRNTERIVSDEAARPPIETDSGPYNGEPAGVEAAIHACGGCADTYNDMTPDEVEQAGARIAYLLKRPPEDSEDALRLVWVREVEQEEWTKIVKSPGQTRNSIIRLEPCPDGSEPERCYPGGESE